MRAPGRARCGPHENIPDRGSDETRWQGPPRGRTTQGPAHVYQKTTGCPSSTLGGNEVYTHETQEGGAEDGTLLPGADADLDLVSRNLLGFSHNTD